MRFLALALAVLLVVLTPMRVLAQSEADTTMARELYLEGVKLTKEKRWQDAKDRFQRSLELKKAALTHFSLGVVHRELDNPVEAIESFRAFLLAPPEAATDPYREAAEQAIAELEPKVGRVVIAIEPGRLEGLVVTIDDVEVPLAALDRPRPVNPGKHRVKAVAPGYHAAEAELEVVASDVTNVELVLERAPEPLPAPGKASRHAQIPDQERGISPLVWVGVGIAAAGLIVGAISGAVSLSAASDVDDQCDVDAKTCPPSAQDDIDRSVLTAHISTAGFAVAGAGAILGIVGLFLSTGDDEAALVIEPGYVGVRGSF